MVKIVLDITEEGDIEGLYTEELDLFAIGRVTNIRKASNVEFNEQSQKWEVSAPNGKILHTNRNRDEAIKWEIRALSPGGEHCSI